MTNYEIVIFKEYLIFICNVHFFLFLYLNAFNLKVKGLKDFFLNQFNFLLMKKFRLLLLSFAFLTFTSAAEDPPYNCSGGTHYGCTNDIVGWIEALPSTCIGCAEFIFIDYCMNPEQIIPVSFCAEVE